MLAEAFITAAGKPEPLPAGQHAADAAAAGLALVELLDSAETLTSTVCCSPQESFNLLTAMALWAEMLIDPVNCARRFSPLPPAISPSRSRPRFRAPEPNRRTEMPMSWLGIPYFGRALAWRGG